MPPPRSKRPRATPAPDPRPDVRNPSGAGLPFAGVLAAATMLAQGTLILALTPVTHHLDDIKKALFYSIGPALGVAGIAGIAKGRVPAPREAVGWSLAAYLAVMLLSTLLSSLGWAGREAIVFQWSAIGFLLGGVAIGSSARASRAYVRFGAAILLATTLLGFLQYDLAGNGRTFTQWLWDRLYGTGPITNEPSNFQALLFTYTSEAKLSLMSTILNRDFFAAFCLAFVPMAIVSTLPSEEPGRGSVAEIAKRALGGVAALFGLVTVLLCQSKGEYIFGAAMLGLLAILLPFALRRNPASLPRASLVKLGAWAAGPALLLGALVLVNLPTIAGQLKSLSISFASRRIIFAGAVGIFRDHPLLGSGPGTFPLFFPRHRSPDYFRHEISNVTECAHNYALDILSETGLAGIVTFGFFAGAFLFLAIRAMFRAEDRGIRLALLATLLGLFGLMGSNMTSTSARWPIGAVNLWTFLGFGIGLVARAEGWKPGASLFSSATAAHASVSGSPRNSADAVWRRRLLIAAAVPAAIGLVAGPLEGIGYWRGARAYNRGLTAFERTIRFYMDAVRAPEKADPQRLETARSYLNDARRHFLETIRLDPDDLSAYYKLGSVENYLAKVYPKDQERYVQAALATYERLRRRAPDYAEIHYNLGIMNYQLSEMRRAERKRVPAENVARRAELEKEIVELEARSRAFYEVMGRMSEKDDVLLNQGIAYQQAGLLEEAKAVFERAMRLYPDDHRFGEWARLTAEGMGDRAGEVAALEHLYRIHPAESTIYLFPAMKMADDADLDEAFLRLVALGDERNPIDPRLFVRLVLFHERRGRPAEALDAGRKLARILSLPEARKILPPDADRPRALEAALRLALEAGDDAAAGAIQKAIDLLAQPTPSAPEPAAGPSAGRAPEGS